MPLALFPPTAGAEGDSPLVELAEPMKPHLTGSPSYSAMGPEEDDLNYASGTKHTDSWKSSLCQALFDFCEIEAACFSVQRSHASTRQRPHTSCCSASFLLL